MVIFLQLFFYTVGKIGKSTRGAVEHPENKVIDENNRYSLITVDTVLDPSGPGCYINDIVMEEKDYMLNEYGLIVECAYDNLQNKLDKYISTPIEEDKKKYMYSAFSDFLKDIRK